jgi:hypothetical protein
MRAAAAALTALVLALGGPAALGQPVQEYELKTAFLYNFALLTDWPRAASVPQDPEFRICVIGRNPFGNSLAHLQGKPVHGRRIALRDIESPSAARECQILFIASSGAGPLNEIIDSLGDSSVLTVTESRNDRATGAVITMLTQEKRVTFAVHLGAARRAKLHISPRLLRVAARVAED